MEASAALGFQDEAALRRVEAWFRSGSAPDFANAARFLLYKAGVVKEAPPEPDPPLLCGIYHPAAKEPFQNLSGYLAWKHETSGVPVSLPFAAVCFPRMWLLAEDMELVHAVMSPLEENGLHPLPVFLRRRSCFQFRRDFL
jgi:cobalamin biosynthesis Mg chelatase CobN